MGKCSMQKRIESLTKNEAAGNSVSNFSRTSLGVSFDGKFGSMRKPADWVIYPTTENDKTFDIQCDNRWGTIDKATGKMLLSAPHSFANSWVLANDVRMGKAQRIQLEPEVLKQLLDAIGDRRITDHSLDNVIRDVDVTDAEIRGESRRRSESALREDAVKDEVIELCNNYIEYCGDDAYYRGEYPTPSFDDFMNYIESNATASEYPNLDLGNLDKDLLKQVYNELVYEFPKDSQRFLSDVTDMLIKQGTESADYYEDLVSDICDDIVEIGSRGFSIKQVVSEILDGTYKKWWNKTEGCKKANKCSMSKRIESLKKTNERLFTLYDIHDKYSDFGKPSCWRNPQFWKDYEDYYNKSYPTMGIKIVLKNDDSVDVSSNGDFIMNYSWKNGRHRATAADGSGFKHPGFDFRDDLSMIYRGATGKAMGPYQPVYVDESKKSEANDDTMVIYKELGTFYTTNKKNYDARIQDANRIQKWDGFDTPQEIIDYCKKYSRGFNPDDVIIVESKKSEVKDNEIPYVMMQYYVPDEKVWEPILVEINSNDTGWFYDGLALMDNLGNFGYDEFSWDFIHQRCKRGTDKCDPELVQSMEKFYLKDFTPDDEYQPRKVDRLGNHIPKGKTYIGKN